MEGSFPRSAVLVQMGHILHASAANCCLDTVIDHDHKVTTRVGMVTLKKSN